MASKSRYLQKKDVLTSLRHQIADHPDKNKITIHFNGISSIVLNDQTKSGRWLCAKGEFIAIEELLQTCNDSHLGADRIHVWLISDCCGAGGVVHRLMKLQNSYPKIAKLRLWVSSDFDEESFSSDNGGRFTNDWLQKFDDVTEDLHQIEVAGLSIVCRFSSN